MTYNYSETIDYLLDWYDLNARILAWRENPQPYYIWVSEIMLQQTRVEAVKAYFDRFVNTLPDIKALAEVEEEKLHKLWEGLGYYNRVRNLQKAAIMIIKDYKGEMPADYEELFKLPGIGSYTAGAIASIAFHIPQPAVDGNVLRVMKRISGSFDDITKASVKKELEQDIRVIMPKDRPGDFNQAIMELGATVCIPNGKPLCDKCPIMHLCTAYHQGTEMSIPVKPKKKPRRLEDKTILLIEKDGKYVIQKRENKGLLAGLWELPSIEGKLTTLALEELLIKQGLEDFVINSLGEGKHIFSHIEWHMVGYHVLINEKMQVAEDSIYVINKLKTRLWERPSEGRLERPSEIRLVSKSQIDIEYTLPSAFEMYRKCMTE